MPRADNGRRLPENDLEKDCRPLGEETVAIAVIWLALYAYMAASAAIVSLGGTIAIAHATQ